MLFHPSIHLFVCFLWAISWNILTSLLNVHHAFNCKSWIPTVSKDTEDRRTTVSSTALYRPLAGLVATVEIMWQPMCFVVKALSGLQWSKCATFLSPSLSLRTPCILRSHIFTVHMDHNYFLCFILHLPGGCRNLNQNETVSVAAALWWAPGSVTLKWETLFFLLDFAPAS